jgi:hypothetical protein
MEAKNIKCMEMDYKHSYKLCMHSVYKSVITNMATARILKLYPTNLTNTESVFE